MGTFDNLGSALPRPDLFIIYYVGLAILYDSIIMGDGGNWEWDDYLAVFVATYVLRRVA